MEDHGFDWLKGVISFSLNPNIHQSKAIDKNLPHIKEWLKPECVKLLIAFQRLRDYGHEPARLKSTMLKFYNELIQLIDEVYYRRGNLTCDSGDLVTANDLVFDELCLLRTKFLDASDGVMGGAESVAADQLNLFSHVVENNLQRITVKIADLHQDETLGKLVISDLNEIKQRIDTGKVVFGRQILCCQQLVDELHHIRPDMAEDGLFCKLEEVLIACNFNSKSVLAHFSGRISSILENKGFESTDLFQTPFDETDHMGFDLHTNSIAELLHSKIKNFERLKRDILGKQPLYSVDSLAPNGRKLNVLTTLSIDQAGLILRSADDANVIVAKSLSAVFKAIVPFLSTNHKETLSWQSMRSKSLNPEERDKEIAVAALQDMITKIKNY